MFQIAQPLTVLSWFKKASVIKSCFLFAINGLYLFFGGCYKERLAADALIDTNLSATTSITAESTVDLIGRVKNRSISFIKGLGYLFMFAKPGTLNPGLNF